MQQIYLRVKKSGPSGWDSVEIPTWYRILVRVAFSPNNPTVIVGCDDNLIHENTHARSLPGTFYFNDKRFFGQIDNGKSSLMFRMKGWSV